MAEQVHLVKKDCLGFLYVDHSDKTLIRQHMNKNFVERGSQEVDKDLPKNKWRWDWLETQV